MKFVLEFNCFFLNVKHCNTMFWCRLWGGCDFSYANFNI